MQQRKNEIAAKRARLEELRRIREERNAEFASSRQSIGVPSEVAAKPESKEDLDDLITSLIGNDKRPRSSLSASTLSVDNAAAPLRASTPAAGSGIGQSQTESLPKTRQTLSYAPLTTVYEIVSEAPKVETVTYSKGVQTLEAWNDGLDREEFEDEDQLSRLGRQRREDELRDQLRKEIEQEHAAEREAQLDRETRAKATIPRGARLLDTEEANEVASSNDFIDFLERSTKVAERALEEDYDVLADYRAVRSSERDDHSQGQGRNGRGIREVVQFYDERWSKKRMITDLDFSPKFPELVLASYTKSPSAPHDPDGLIMVWNQHMQSRPEYKFQANSDILTARFSPFHPNLIFGGTYSGQVLLWDTRSHSQTAVQSTPLTMLSSQKSFNLDTPRAAGHTSPIYSLTFSGTSTAYSILSTSTDGTFCAWAPDMLTQPSERLQLLDPYPKSVLHPASDLAPSCLALPVSSSAESHALVGTEQGGMYLVHRQDRTGGAGKAGIDPRVLYAGHSAPIMSLDFHKAVSPLDLSDLALSAGLDWSIKLWRIREASDTPSTAFDTNNSSRPGTSHASRQSTYTPSYLGGPKIDIQQPLLDIRKDDAIYDVKWSPARPSIFASVDGGGALEIWDLNENIEVPVARAWVSERAASNGRPGGVNGGAASSVPDVLSTLDAKLAQSTAGPPKGCLGNSLNKCAWEYGEARRVAVGGLDGTVTVFEVGEKLGGRKGVEVGEWEGVRRLVGRCEGGGW